MPDGVEVRIRCSEIFCALVFDENAESNLGIPGEENSKVRFLTSSRILIGSDQ